jgi:hypothetical protein
MPVLLATWKAQDGGLRPAQARSLHDPISINKQQKTGGMHTLSQLSGKHKWEDCGPDQPRQKCETLFGKYIKQNGLRAWLKR